jgi:hypothetical protein
MAQRIPEEHIRQLLQRAAELQHDSEFSEESNEDSALLLEDPTLSKGFDLKVLQEAAGEVGISAQHLALAAAELSVIEKPVSEEMLIKASAFLNHRDRSLSITRKLDEPPKKVLQVLNNLAPSNEYRLKLQKVYGDDPLIDGILVYKTPTMEEWSSEVSSFAMGMYYADIKHVFISLRPHGDDGSSTMMTIHASLGRALKLNYYVGKGSVYGLGGLSVLGVGFLTAFNPLLTLGLGIFAGLGVGFGTHKGYQWLYGWGLKKGKQALESLVDSVAMGCKALSWN